MVAVFAVPVIFAITLHEAAHGYVARHFGDTTAFMLGRVSLNPGRHIDLVGTVFLPLVTLFATGGRIMFGWAKPVPVNFHALRHPKRDMLWVALAGPAANLVMALGWAAALKIGALSGLRQSDFLIQVPLAGVEVNLVFISGCRSSLDSSSSARTDTTFSACSSNRSWSRQNRLSRRSSNCIQSKCTKNAWSPACAPRARCTWGISTAHSRTG